MEELDKKETIEDLSLGSNPLISLCLALSNEKNITRLLELIVTKARHLTCAEAGSLYMVGDNFLSFEILQNDPMGLNFKKGDTDSSPMKSVPLYKNSRPNYSNISSCAALTGSTINIEDVYNSGTFDFTGTKIYDKNSGFRSRSILTVPLKDHEDETVAVIQLINRKNSETGEIGPFSESDINLIEAIASQTAIAIVKTKLIDDLKNLLYSFIKAIAWAVDAKSSYTGAHIKRVVNLSMRIAQLVNETKAGIFESREFNEEELLELNYSAWMHDIGKIVTPQHIIDKGTRLEKVYDGMALIEKRFDLIQVIEELTFYKSKPPKIDPAELEKRLEEIKFDLEFVINCNDPNIIMDDTRIEQLKKIRKKKYVHNGVIKPYLTKEEFEYLSVIKGTLTEKEREIIENHAIMTKKILQHVPFPKGLTNVPVL
ncbi:MAG: GAF domain-containing protein, partial [Desulfobacteraceae bacterium]|nr:GAF domain-containing protein [Desulfobacteraceae bacterium]